MVENAGLMGAKPLVRFFVLDVARMAGEIDFRVTLHQRRNVVSNTLIGQIKLYTIRPRQ
jgi:hypothetical protein